MKLKRLEESFDEIHQAYLHYRDVGKDKTDYVESFKVYGAVQPDPDPAKKEAREKSANEALAKQLKEQSPKKVRNQGTRFRGRFGKVRKVLV